MLLAAATMPALASKGEHETPTDFSTVEKVAGFKLPDTDKLQTWQDRQDIRQSNRSK